MTQLIDRDKLTTKHTKRSLHLQIYHTDLSHNNQGIYLEHNGFSSFI